MSAFFKILFFSLFAAGSFGIICWMFWEQEVKYMKPTIKPKGFIETASLGEIRSLAGFTTIDTNKPTMLHFFSSNCPCSRFNMREISHLAEKYGKQVNFIVVLQDRSAKSANEFIEKYELDMHIVLDSLGTISDFYGIYSTPQTVLLNESERIFYKGNYNKARFCNSRKTAFADLAITSLLSNQQLPRFEQQASMPYGCSLPSDDTSYPSFLSTINIFN